jgi:TonB family protein
MAFEPAYREFAAAHYQLASTMFVSIAESDTQCYDTESYELWAQSLYHLGLDDSGRAVLDLGAQRIQRTVAKQPNAVGYSDRLDEILYWKSIYPTFPKRFEEENGFVPHNRDPVAVHKVNPEYPSQDLEQGIEGTVWAIANVDTLGKVIDAWGLKYPNERLLNAALAALRQFEFSPFRLKGTLARCTVAVPFRFKLSQ